VKRVRLLDVADIERGTEPGSNSYCSPSAGIRFLRVGDITGKGCEAIYTNSDNVKLVNENDVLMTFDGTPGFVNMGLKGYISSGIRRVVPKDENVLNRRYLYYALQTDNVKQSILRYSSGQTIVHSSKSIPHLEIPLPSLSEQKRIVEILEKVDTLHKKRQEADELSSRMMSAIFCNMFNDYLYGKNITGIIMLGEAIRIKRPLVDPRKKEFQHLPHINGEVIESKTSKLLKYNTVAEEKLISSKFVFEKSDVLYNKIRPYLCKATIPGFRGLCSADMYPVTPQTDFVLPEYLLWLLLSDKFTAYAV